jgi:hypothetical protein
MEEKKVGSFRNRAVTAISSVPRAKVLAFVLIVLVPGGLVVPACYAVYQAIRHSLTR